MEIWPNKVYDTSEEFSRLTKRFSLGKRVLFSRFWRRRNKKKHGILFNRVRGDIILYYRDNR